MLTITDVETFHRTFGHPIKTSKEYLSHFATPEIGNDDNPVLPECSTNPDLRLRRLRTDLILEECKELDHACNHDDPIEYADALFDILYVTLGAIVSLGVPRSIGDEVQRSNMSKGMPCDACAGLGFCTNSHLVDDIRDTEHTTCTKCNGASVVAIKREDGKILKGPNYSPVDIASIIEKECRDWDKDAEDAQQ